MPSTASTSSTEYTYSVFGLRVRSDVSLPELSPAAHPDADVTIGWADLTAEVAGHDGPGPLVRGTPDEVLLHYDEVGSVQITGGEVIRYDAYHDCAPETLRVVLLGIGLGILLHQRGRLVLHASAAAVQGCAVAFIGEKGWGKSTTVAAFQEAGYPLITDDILPIELGEDAAPRVWPGYAQLKLWKDALDGTLGTGSGNLERVQANVEKYLTPVSRLSRRALPLHAIFVLGFGDAVAMHPLRGRTAFLHVLQHTYTRAILDYTGAGTRHLQQATALLEHTPLLRLVRPRGLEHLPRVVERVAAHVRPAADAPRDTPTH